MYQGRAGKAGHDFDTAVAVSADGTKIVHADWVVVPEHTRYNIVTSLRIYPGSAFRDRRILRSSEQYSRSEQFLDRHGDYELAKARNWSLSQQIGQMVGHKSWLEQLREHPYRQWYATTRALYAERVEQLPQASVLITPLSSCPSPLPEGGVEVQV